MHGSDYIAFTSELYALAVTDGVDTWRTSNTTMMVWISKPGNRNRGERDWTCLSVSVLISGDVGANK